MPIDWKQCPGKKTWQKVMGSNPRTSEGLFPSKSPLKCTCMIILRSNLHMMCESIMGINFLVCCNCTWISNLIKSFRKISSLFNQWTLTLTLKEKVSHTLTTCLSLLVRIRLFWKWKKLLHEEIQLIPNKEILWRQEVMLQSDPSPFRIIVSFFWF